MGRKSVTPRKREEGGKSKGGGRGREDTGERKGETREGCARVRPRWCGRPCKRQDPRGGNRPRAAEGPRRRRRRSGQSCSARPRGSPGRVSESVDKETVTQARRAKVTGCVGVATAQRAATGSPSASGSGRGFDAQQRGVGGRERAGSGGSCRPGADESGRLTRCSWGVPGRGRGGTLPPPH